MDRYDFYAKGAGGHSFNIPYNNKDDPIRSGKSIPNSKADYRNVYDTMIAVAGADDKTLLDLGYTKAAQVKAQKIVNKLDSALSSTISKVTSDGAQKDAEENIVSFGDDYLKIIDWDNLSLLLNQKCMK